MLELKEDTQECVRVYTSNPETEGMVPGGMGQAGAGQTETEKSTLNLSLEIWLSWRTPKEDW
jgi:hypothetical protein